MFKLFNKTRKKSLSENRFSKYLLYAIGEIILVVIGILIALQINTTNQSKNQAKKTNTYLKTLDSEILLNIDRINSKLEVIRFELNEAAKTMAYLNSEEATYYNDSTLRVGMNTRPIYKVVMAKSTFDDLINSGTLEYLSDVELKNKILKIESYIDYSLETFENAKNVWIDYQLPYLMKYSNISGNWDTISKVKVPELPFVRQKSAFVYNQEYANILALRMRMINNYEETLIEANEYFKVLSGDIKVYLGEEE